MLFQSLVTTRERSEVAVISDTVNTRPQHCPSTGSQSLKTITLLGKRPRVSIALFLRLLQPVNLLPFNHAQDGDET